MRKRNEGYALPFVLVVMVVLCAISVAILSGSLRNLKSQQATTERMQDQYAAQGQIERIVATLESRKTVSVDVLKEAGIDEQNVEIPASLESDATKLSLKVTVIHGTVQIACELELNSSKPITTTNGVYGFDDLTITYVSYEIETVSVSQEEGGEGE